MWVSVFTQALYGSNIFMYLYSSISIFCPVILPLQYILEANIAVFTQLHLYD